jgi:ABC-type Fe3+-hydroxamate transport system substrate-binding protein
MDDITLLDAAGTRHAQAGSDARIVSLVPSITELVCDLGLTAQLVGRTGFCIHPRDKLRSIAKLGGTKDVDIKALRAQQPSHVILNIDENERTLAQALAGFVPHLVVTHPLGPRDNPPLYRLLGGIFGKQAQAESLCRRFDDALSSIDAQRDDFAPERVLYLIWKDPWMTVARSTYISASLALVNWQTLPVAAEPRYPVITLGEEWLGCIDRVLLSSEPYRFGPAHCAALRKLPALAGKPVDLIDGEMTSWYGSRAITGLGYLARLRRTLEQPV